MPSRRQRLVKSIFWPLPLALIRAASRLRGSGLVLYHATRHSSDETPAKSTEIRITTYKDGRVVVRADYTTLKMYKLFLRISTQPIVRLMNIHEVARGSPTKRKLLEGLRLEWRKGDASVAGACDSEDLRGLRNETFVILPS